MLDNLRNCVGTNLILKRFWDQPKFVGTTLRLSVSLGPTLFEGTNLLVLMVGLTYSAVQILSAFPG